MEQPLLITDSLAGGRRGVLSQHKGFGVTRPVIYSYICLSLALCAQFGTGSYPGKLISLWLHFPICSTEVMILPHRDSENFQ